MMPRLPRYFRLVKPAISRRFRKGGSLLEMVLVMPVLLMLSFGIVDYGYFFFLKSTIQGAAQAGARASIVSGASNTDVTNAVSAVLTPAGLSSSNYTVTTSPTTISSAATGTNVTVTITCSWGTVGYHTLPSALGGIPNSKQLTVSSVMRKE